MIKKDKSHSIMWVRNPAQVYPYIENSGQKQKNNIYQVATNAKEWCISALGLPMFYICLPLSFCIRPPLWVLSNRPTIVSREDDTPTEKFASHFASAVEGLFTCMSCCCCFGCCCTKNPDDFY
jgi:hypothetical protein